MPYNLIGLGGTCYVTTTDNKTALKSYQIWQDGEFLFGRDACEDELAREATIYRHLGDHPQILRCFGLEQQGPGVHALRLELAPLGCVRQFIEATNPSAPPPWPARLGMALDMARGVAHLHARGVQYCDMSCRNAFLFAGYRVKLGDFGASLLEGHAFQPTFCEESRYELPLRGRTFRGRPVLRRELFALGSAVYEITMWTRPFAGLAEEEVEARYAQEAFPAVEGNPAGPIIRQCWDEAVDSAEAVVAALAEVAAAMGVEEPTGTEQQPVDVVGRGGDDTEASPCTAFAGEQERMSVETQEQGDSIALL